MFEHNKYHKKYFQIVHRAKNRQLDPTIKVEIHHIIPRSLGGTDSSDNLVTLTLKEHWICHRLLVKFIVDSTALRKMYNALFIMAVKDYRTVNARIYKEIKENVVPWNKGLSGLYQPPLSDMAKQKLSHLYKGKKRPQAHVDAMKEGWRKAKENGYKGPWNTGKTGIYRKGKPVIITSPDGKQYPFDRLKDGCKELGLTYTHMSSVNSGKKTNWKGWTVMSVNMA